MRVLYLHGFASSASSSKATFLTNRFQEQGIQVRTPDLNRPDFSTLTVSRMLQQTDEAIDEMPDEPLVVIGSSLGGFVAIQAAARRPERIHRLALLAPAIDFGGTRMRQLGGTGLADWKRAGRINVFHYGYGRMMPIHYELYEDASHYSAWDVDLLQPVTVFQGRRDESVDPAIVEAWAQERRNVELHMLDDDHQLAASLPFIWSTLRTTLELGDVERPALTSKSRDSRR
jgi:hypothetical protein